MANKSVVGLEMVTGDKLIEQLKKLAIAVREEIGRDALHAGMTPVRQAIIANSPESSVTGSRDKQSAQTKMNWSGSRKLKTTIRQVVRVMKKAGITSGMLGYVGPSYSDGGGHGNLFGVDHTRKVYWGRDGGGPRIVNQFVKKSADETQSASKAAVIATMTAGIEKYARATTNG